MAELIYKIEFYSDWHCGSGLSSGAEADLLVIKDRNELPFVPGKTLKGLLLDAGTTLKEAGVLSEEFISTLFGQVNDNKSGTKPGSGYFSNATLTEKMQNNLINGKQQPLLYRNISSTAIEEKGQAKEHSLRTIQVTVPLTLFAKISNLESEQVDAITKCLKMIKRLGTGRNRGYGRCDILKVEVK